MTRSHIDHIAVYSGLSDALDAAVKEIIPGRRPWGTRTEARRWLADYYAALCQEEADRHGVGVSTIRRKHGPGVTPFFPGIAAKFGGAS